MIPRTFNGVFFQSYVKLPMGKLVFLLDETDVTVTLHSTAQYTKSTVVVTIELRGSNGF